MKIIYKRLKFQTTLTLSRVSCSTVFNPKSRLVSTEIHHRKLWQLLNSASHQRALKDKATSKS